MIIFPLPWNHLWQNQITADWLLYWWKMRHISFQEMCDNTIRFMNANKFLVEVKLSTLDFYVTMKACFICRSLLQVFDEEVSACCKTSILNIFILTCLCLVLIFVFAFVGGRWDILSFIELEKTFSIEVRCSTFPLKNSGQLGSKFEI